MPAVDHRERYEESNRLAPRRERHQEKDAREDHVQSGGHRGEDADGAHRADHATAPPAPLVEVHGRGDRAHETGWEEDEEEEAEDERDDDEDDGEGQVPLHQTLKSVPRL